MKEEGTELQVYLASYLSWFNQDDISLHQQSPGEINERGVPQGPLQHDTGRERGVQVGIVWWLPGSSIVLHPIQPLGDVLQASSHLSVSWVLLEVVEADIADDQEENENSLKSIPGKRRT